VNLSNILRAALLASIFPVANKDTIHLVRVIRFGQDVSRFAAGVQHVTDLPARAVTPEPA
jgi:hypothetical protein